MMGQRDCIDHKEKPENKAHPVSKVILDLLVLMGKMGWMQTSHVLLS